LVLALLALLAVCQTGSAVSPQDVERALADFGADLLGRAILLDFLVAVTDDTLDNDAEYQLLKKNTFDAIRDVTPLLELDYLSTLIQNIHSPFNFSEEEAATEFALITRQDLQELSEGIQNLVVFLGDKLVKDIRTAYGRLVALQETAGLDVQRVSEDSARVQAELDLLGVKMKVKKGISKLSLGLFGDNAKTALKIQENQEALSRDELLSVYYKLIQKGPMPALADFETFITTVLQYATESAADYATMADPNQVSDEMNQYYFEFIRQETPAVLESVGVLQQSLESLTDSISKMPPCSGDSCTPKVTAPDVSKFTNKIRCMDFYNM